MNNTWTLTPEEKNLKQIFDKQGIEKYTPVYKNAAFGIIEWEESEIYDETLHPRYKELQKWISSEKINKLWYKKNSDKIKLVEDWIYIAWEIWDLDDLKSTEKNNRDINGTFFYPNEAIEELEIQWKDLVLIEDFGKLWELFEDDTEYKISEIEQVKFLKNIIGLKGGVFVSSALSEMWPEMAQYMWTLKLKESENSLKIRSFWFNDSNSSFLWIWDSSLDILNRVRWKRKKV